jgi:multidrug/hemolysin transport system permease protein
MTVFFSMVAPVIMFVLFVVFLRKTMAKVIADAVGSTNMDDSYALCDAWMFASVATVATFSTSLGMLTAFVEDRVTGRFSDYLVAPIRRWQLALGYVLAVLCVSFVISTAIFFVGQGWAWWQDQAVLSATEDARVVGAIFVSSLVFSAFNTLMVTFTSTQGSYGGYSIVMGTAMGFLSFCYVTPSSLSQTINSVLSSLPFAQTAAIIRLPAMTPAADQFLADLPEGSVRDDAIRDLMTAIGARLTVDDHVLSTAMILAILLAVTVVLSLVASWRMGRIIH